jgi:predicted RNA binding protein YcfA (HicA-like mRNA interferase family)
MIVNTVPLFRVIITAKAMKYSEVERKCSKNHCYFLRGGAHPVWYSEITRQEFLLSNHKQQEVPPGTLKKISKASGVAL